MPRKRRSPAAPPDWAAATSIDELIAVPPSQVRYHAIPAISARAASSAHTAPRSGPRKTSSGDPPRLIGSGGAGPSTDAAGFGILDARDVTVPVCVVGE